MSSKEAIKRELRRNHEKALRRLIADYGDRLTEADISAEDTVKEIISMTSMLFVITTLRAYHDIGGHPLDRVQEMIKGIVDVTVEEYKRCK